MFRQVMAHNLAQSAARPRHENLHYLSSSNDGHRYSKLKNPQHRCSHPVCITCIHCCEWIACHVRERSPLQLEDKLREQRCQKTRFSSAVSKSYGARELFSVNS